MCRNRKNRYKKFREEFGKNPLEKRWVDRVRGRLDRIKIYHEELLEKEGTAQTIDDITWNDLEMDEVFLRINQTKSFLGEQLLYHKLHVLNSDVADARMEDKIRFLTENEELRFIVEEQLGKIGKNEGHYQLPVFFMNTASWKVQNGWLLRILQVLLAVFLAGSILTEQVLFVGGLGIVALINLMIYLYVKQRYEVFLFSLGSLKEIFHFCNRILADEKWDSRLDTEEVRDANKKLKKVARRIISWQGRKTAGMTGDMLGLIQDYLMGITLLDVAAFNRIVTVLGDKCAEVRLLYEFAGELDMLISIASFRESLDDWCEPKIEECAVIGGTAIAHPLLVHPVANDFCLEKAAIITGANASGKSTFMKSVAINVILAQTIRTCVAKEFYLPKIMVMTSMALRDDILSGESYYVKEIKYLKRMLDAMIQHLVLCVVDEILKGTNTKERLEASEAILKYMSEQNCYVLLATHDKELVDRLQDEYESYFFESQIVENDIWFDYQIRKGKGGASNAVELLSLFGFPEEIMKSIKAG